MLLLIPQTCEAACGISHAPAVLCFAWSILTCKKRHLHIHDTHHLNHFIPVVICDQLLVMQQGTRW